MTDIRFYHIQKKTPESVVFELAERALARGHKILIRLRDENDARRLDEFLWTAKPDSFLPHGAAADGSAGRQPVYLTATNDNPNSADVVFLMPGCETGGIDGFTLCCDILDGRDGEQIAAARARYRYWKAQAHNLSYWQQSDSGKWEQK